MVYHSKTQTLTAFYSDRSVYHWMIENNNDGNAIAKISSQFFHAGPLFDIEVSCYCLYIFFFVVEILEICAIFFF